MGWQQYIHPQLFPVPRISNGFCSSALPGVGDSHQDLLVRAERQHSRAPGMCKHTVWPAGKALWTCHPGPDLKSQLWSWRYDLKGVMSPCSWFPCAQGAEIPSYFCMFWSCSFPRLCGKKTKEFDKKQESQWEVLLRPHHTVSVGMAQPLASSRSIWFSTFQEKALILHP